MGKEKKEFDELIERSDNEYKAGEYKKSISSAAEASEVAKNEEELTLAQNRRAWAERYVGLKTDDAQEKEEMYKIARVRWERVLEMSEDIDIRVSAIKGLMLLPSTSTIRLCRSGIEEVEEQILDYQRREDLKGEFRNSEGIEVRKANPWKAERIFLNAWSSVTERTVIAGHLVNNAGVCHLILKNEAKDKVQKRKHATKAVQLLRIALGEYPMDQTEHIRAAQSKIKNTLKEITNDFEETK